MAWSIFTNGPQAAVSWADSLLASLNLPTTNWRVRFIYDWEKSEGGGGKNNPLNQGPVPGSPGLTSTGTQYGGGAADYVSPAAGIQGAVDYLHMPNYASVLDALQAPSSNTPGTNYADAVTALEQSPWAGGHYGYGSAWNTTPVPGGSKTATLDASILTILEELNPLNAGGSIGNAIGGAGHGTGLIGGGIGGLTTFLTNPVGTIFKSGENLILRGFLILVGIILLFIGVSKLFSGNTDSNPAITIVEGSQKVAKTTAKAGKTVSEKGGEAATAVAA